MYTQKEKDGMAMKNDAIDKIAVKQDCDDGYYWNGTNCVQKGPLHSTGAKIGVGAGIAGAIGVGVSMISNAIKNKKEKKEAKAKAEAEKNKKQ